MSLTTKDVLQDILTALRIKDTSLAGCVDNLAAAKAITERFGEDNKSEIANHLRSFGHKIDEGLADELVKFSKSGQTELQLLT